MASRAQYDGIVIGAGQAGGPLATTLAKAGWKMALIERERIGGTCVNVGCTPTKTMVASARVAYLARRAADYGVRTGPISVDMSVVRRRKREIVNDFRSGSEQGVKETPNLDLLMGEARFTGPKTLIVTLNDGGQREITAETILINSGQRPAMPKIAGIESVPLLTSTTIMELDAVPAHLLVLGGGFIGLEFAQMFRRFGSAVTIIQRGTQLAPKEDEDVAAGIAKIFREDGITVLLETETVRAARSNDGGIALTVKDAGGERTLTGSHFLVAAGRTPNTDALDPAAAGITMDKRGYLPVNERLQTNVPGIYALGDVNGGPAFTHISYDDFRILRANLLHGGNETTVGRLVPNTVFIDPQLGRVGLSERAARAQGKKIRVAKLPMTSVARALEMDETRGFMKAVVDTTSGQILGCAILGVEGGEIMSVIQMAMIGHLPYPVLKDAVLAHPTLAESLNNLFSTLEE
ncbi:MAG: mercuric reductase [Thermomicrobia bacterium]|nr:mercuric reductase [Thermomicrobia bacterium]MCA1723843.1 mercuric reductase [Thermomicrobia bacterium]